MHKSGVIPKGTSSGLSIYDDKVFRLVIAWHSSYMYVSTHAPSYNPQSPQRNSSKISFKHFTRKKLTTKWDDIMKLANHT